MCTGVAITGTDYMSMGTDVSITGSGWLTMGADVKKFGPGWLIDLAAIDVFTIFVCSNI